MLHAKTAVIDGVWSTVGSFNLDYRSIHSNDELNVVILGKPFAARLEQVFQNDLRHTKAINPNRWDSRPFLQHVREDSAQTLRYLF
jgi:cardiolipin synthase